MVKFQPAIRPTLFRVVAVAAALLAIGLSVQYQLARRHAAALLAPPPGTDRRVVSGRVAGPLLGALAPDAVAAQVTLWSGRIGAKGSRVVCKRTVHTAFTIDGTPLAELPATADPASTPFVVLDRPSSPIAPVPAGLLALCAGISGQGAEARILRPGDVATARGCLADGVLRPCRDADDVLVSRNLDGARAALSSDAAAPTILSALFGLAALLYLVRSLGRYTASTTGARAADPGSP